LQGRRLEDKNLYNSHDSGHDRILARPRKVTKLSSWACEHECAPGVCTHCRQRALTGLECRGTTGTEPHRSWLHSTQEPLTSNPHTDAQWERIFLNVEAAHTSKKRQFAVRINMCGAGEWCVTHGHREIATPAHPEVTAFWLALDDAKHRFQNRYKET